MLDSGRRAELTEQLYNRNATFVKKGIQAFLKRFVGLKKVSPIWRNEVREIDIGNVHGVNHCMKNYLINIIPHSCGNPCGKKRKATCPHPCPILCHPGPCPPCGAMKTDIKCWSHGNPIAIRCGETNLSCKNPCKKLLSCGIHSCSLECHDGECKPCDKIRTIQCYCGKSQNNTTCNQNQEDSFSCGEICDQTLCCGNHHCKMICHPPHDYNASESAVLG
ncbi:MAG: putative FKBP12-associated protein 1 [Streblomastix strix]|uniref:Putative FKBP12-associated protein 1 n=1 Tax=Streblomastix strix TaxID=222440 RepID=A0A5J4WAT8_9EUKA|nr:MAG: putative FKBP12-associated protein 1 [Streblomastix strix]